jgi:hypothetical protein
MERNDRQDVTPAELIELGTASKDTLGALGEIIEPMGLWHKAGISEE